MTPEELMRPRYKVIADYPKSIYHIGDIINAGGTGEDCIYCDREGPRMRYYPHLFKELAWWEDRKPEEMPRFVKTNTGEVVNIKSIADDGTGELYYTTEGDELGWYFYQNGLLPATEEEYIQYKNQNK